MAPSSESLSLKKHQNNMNNNHRNQFIENGIHSSNNIRVAVVGGGLVGSMVTCYLARRGYQVDLFEMRTDPRKTEIVAGKSINLALSERGRSALRVLGLENEIVEKYSIKMYSRMIHNVDGKKRVIPYGTRKDQCILSVSRRFLNEMLLTEAEKYKNVSIKFQHKLFDANLKQGKLFFQVDDNKNNNNNHDSHTTNENDKIVDEKSINGKVEGRADIILGCDGAYSAIRRHMIKLLLLDYSQKYIEHGYLELNIPPTETGDFAMEPNYLHIWPRGQFMMIALPNLDRSFTVTLFMQFKIFEQLTDEKKLLKFFEENFKDSIPLLTREGLIETFFSNKPSPLISIKCRPYNYQDKVLLMGDAAHAMVPFYGQGMNCGFEDCFELDKLLKENGNDNLGSVLEQFTEIRADNCHAIIDLAMYNYIEMRDLVNRKSFLLRKWFDNTMYAFFPNIWVPLYTMVTFSRTPYHQCIRDKKWQDDIIDSVLKFLCIIFGLILFIIAARFLEHSPTLNQSHISN